MQPLSSSLRTEVMLISIVTANLINWLLHGILTVQLYFYYLAFPDDSNWAKVPVYTVYILETIQVISLGIIQLLFIVSGSSLPARPIFGSYWTSGEYKWAAQALLITLIGGLVPFIAQCIYAHRIRIITRGKAIPGVINALATLQLFAAILINIPAKISVMAMCAFMAGLHVVTDLIIAFVMVRSLSKEVPLSDHTRSTVIRLVHLIIATGSLTVAFNILAVISLSIDTYIMGDWIISTGLGIFMSKVYANSILVMLNNRMTVRNSRDVTFSNMISINPLSTLVIADRQTGSSDFTTSRDEVSLVSTSATRYSI